jgi:hypothetical protein
MKNEKKCKRCEKTLEITEDNFYRHSKTSDGYQSYCKVCDKKTSKKSYENNLEENREKRKKWQKENYELHLKHNRKYQNKLGIKKYSINEFDDDLTDEIIARRLAEYRVLKEYQISNYYKKNRDKIKKYNRKYYLKNKDKINEIIRKWQKNNENKIKEYYKAYYKENKDKLKKCATEWQKNNRKKKSGYDKKYYQKNRIGENDNG